MDGHMNTLKSGNLARVKRFILRELRLADGSAKERGSARAGETSKEDAIQQWRVRGGAFAAKGKIEKALHCRRQAVELEPANEQLRLELVRELVLAGRFEEAKSSDGGLVQLWCILGGGFPAEGHPDLGLFCRRRAVELAPTDTNA